MSDAIEELKNQHKHRDRVVRMITQDGLFRCAAINNSTAARTAQIQHGLDVVSATILSRTMAGASMLASGLTGEERVIITIESNGYIRYVYVEALQVGEVRGYLRKAHRDDLPPIDSIESVLGLGLFKVQQIHYNNPEPTTGIVELRRGDIQTDLAYYLTQSEQIASAVILDTEFNDHGEITSSGGVMVQAMPGASPENIKEIVESLTILGSVAHLWNKGYSPEDVVRQVLPLGVDILNSTPVDFFCRCSHAKFISMLSALDLKEILEMRSENQNELVCQYCTKKYHLTEADFETLIETMQARSN